jgi:hypothetical protein
MKYIDYCYHYYFQLNGSHLYEPAPPNAAFFALERTGAAKSSATTSTSPTEIQPSKQEMGSTELNEAKV